MRWIESPKRLRDISVSWFASVTFTETSPLKVGAMQFRPKVRDKPVRVARMKFGNEHDAGQKSRTCHREKRRSRRLSPCLVTVFVAKSA